MGKRQAASGSDASSDSEEELARRLREQAAAAVRGASRSGTAGQRRGFSLWWRLWLLARGQFFWLLFGGIWLVVGSAFLLATILEVRNHRRFEREGVATTGIVLVKGINRADSDNEETDYWVRYRFTTPDGVQVEGTDEVSLETWESLEERGPIEVEYLASDPRRNRIAGSDSRWQSLLFGGLSGVMMLVGGASLGKGLRGALATWRLLRSGEAADAIVTAIRASSLQVNGVRQREIHYRYRDQLGKEHRGRSFPLPPEEAEAWSIGQVGRVRYDPRRPQHSVWVGRE